MIRAASVLILATLAGLCLVSCASLTEATAIA